MSRRPATVHRRPARCLGYTLVEILVALFVGGTETLGMVQGELNLTGPFWAPIASLNNNFGMLGYVIIGIFMVSWIVSVAFYKLKRYDEI